MNEVRIISGKWKRRKLAFPSREQLRPTPDRTRETLFNWLAAHIGGARCLDLFAGSGALGFEAASRGAQHCTLVDNDPVVVRALIASRDRLGANECEIVRADGSSFLRSDRAQPPWDIVFLDPPFDSDLITDCLSLLARPDMLSADARVYVEHRIRESPDFGTFAVVKTARAGESAAALLMLGGT